MTLREHKNQSFKLNEVAKRLYQNAKRPYVRVSPTKRQLLIELVESNQLTIKASARKLKVNYSTAKAIIKEHRNKNKEVVKNIQLELDNTQNVSSKAVPGINVDNSSGITSVFDFSAYSLLIMAKYSQT